MNHAVSRTPRVPDDPRPGLMGKQRESPTTQTGSWLTQPRAARGATRDGSQGAPIQSEPWLARPKTPRERAASGRLRAITERDMVQGNLLYPRMDPEPETVIGTPASPSAPPTVPGARVDNRSRRSPRRWTARIAALGGSGVLKRGAWGLSDQALISVTNFVTMVLLARSLSPSAFGAFTIVYTGIFVASSVQSALLTTPQNILGATYEGAEYTRYTSSVAVGQVAFTVAMTAVALTAAVIVRSAGWSGAALVFALIPAVAATQMQQFVRGVMYTENRLRAAFANDLVSYGGQIVVVALLWFRYGLTGERALILALAATSAAAALLGIWQIRSSISGGSDLARLQQNWQFGKWLLGGEIAGPLIADQLYLYLAAAILSTAAVGALKAAQVLFGPLRIFVYSLNLLLPIHFSRVFARHGKEALDSQMRLALIVATPLLGLFCLLVAVFARPLLALVYGDRYRQYAGVLTLYAAYAFLNNMAPFTSSALKAMRRTRVLFASYLYAALITVLLGWFIIRSFGINGAVAGMIATALTLNVLLWRAYRRDSVPGPVEPIAASSIHDEETMPLALPFVDGGVMVEATANGAGTTSNNFRAPGRREAYRHGDYRP